MSARAASHPLFVLYANAGRGRGRASSPHPLSSLVILVHDRRPKLNWPLNNGRRMWRGFNLWRPQSCGMFNTFVWTPSLFVNFGYLLTPTHFFADFICGSPLRVRREGIVLSLLFNAVISFPRIFLCESFRFFLFSKKYRPHQQQIPTAYPASHLGGGPTVSAIYFLGKW